MTSSGGAADEPTPPRPLPEDPTEAAEGNHPAASSVVAGIASALIVLLSGGFPTLIVSSLLGLAALALGITGLRESRRGRGAGGQAIAGMATGSLSLLVLLYVAARALTLG